MMTDWRQPQSLEDAQQTQIFSGGACNILDASGTLLRNTERDPVNNWLAETGYRFFDPQIHPDTHGTEYVYDVHQPIEVAARHAAKINLYEVSPRTFSGITSFEIAADHFRYEEPTVIYFSDGDSNKDGIPAHSPKGHPLFVPFGINENAVAMKAHYREFIKNANNMRKYVMHFAREMNSLSVTFSDNPARGDIVITPERMHATDLLKAVVDAASNHRTFVTFTGGEKARDEKGNPTIVIPNEPRQVDLETYLDQYVDEGNALRQSIAELVEISVFVRVVYTQRAVRMALEEVLEITGTKPVVTE